MPVTDPVDSRPVRLAAVAQLPPDQPVVMINLLKFNGGAGPDRYRQYAREAAPHLARVGARVRYGGTAPVTIIGDGDRPTGQPWWDAILVVEYPTPAAFLDMVSDPEYQRVHEHRAAALQRGDLVATSSWSIAE
ncbi:DUF1330 domain-containing protein [Mycolicibacterium thermoresistibile]